MACMYDLYGSCSKVSLMQYGLYVQYMACMAHAAKAAGFAPKGAPETDGSDAGTSVYSSGSSRERTQFRSVRPYVRPVEGLYMYHCSSQEIASMPKASSLSERNISLDNDHIILLTETRYQLHLLCMLNKGFQMLSHAVPHKC